MAAPARFHDTGARSDFNRLTRRCGGLPLNPIQLNFNLIRLNVCLMEPLVGRS
jgi:hypothetical protein